MSRAKRLFLKSRSINHRVRATFSCVEDVSSETLAPQSLPRMSRAKRLFCRADRDAEKRPARRNFDDVSTNSFVFVRFPGILAGCLERNARPHPSTTIPQHDHTPARPDPSTTLPQQDHTPARPHPSTTSPQHDHTPARPRPSTTTPQHDHAPARPPPSTTTPQHDHTPARPHPSTTTP